MAKFHIMQGGKSEDGTAKISGTGKNVTPAIDVTA